MIRANYQNQVVLCNIWYSQGLLKSFSCPFRLPLTLHVFPASSLKIGRVEYQFFAALLHLHALEVVSCLENSLYFLLRGNENEA